MFDHIDTKHSDVIVVHEKLYDYAITVHFLSREHALFIHRQIPRSYHMHLGTMSYGDSTPKHATITGIGRRVLDITSGKDYNEINKDQLLKIKQILKKLLPDFRVVTQIYVPKYGCKGTFTLDKQIEGWL